MEDSILPPSLPIFFADSSTPSDNAQSTQSPPSGFKGLTIQTDSSLLNSVSESFGFLDVRDRGKESPISPTSNKLRRAAAIRVNKIPSHGLRKGPVDKQEQRKERSKLLRRSLSLNDTEAILEHVSIPLDQTQEASHTKEMSYRRKHLRRSRSFNEELNSGILLEPPEQPEEDQANQVPCVQSPVETPQEIEDSSFGEHDDIMGASLGIKMSKRPLARRSRSFNAISNGATRNAELLRTYSSHAYREKEPNTVYSEGPLGFFSQKFNATQEPKRDRISGIMKSWKTEGADTPTSSLGLVYSDSGEASTPEDALDLISSITRKLSSGAIKFHKPKVSRIVIQNPSESRALFQPAVPEQLVSDSSLRNDEYQGLFPPSKEIKASRVQFNTRSSLEMRLTKEKLCSVIVEDIAERKQLSTGKPMPSEAPPQIVYPQESKDHHRAVEVTIPPSPLLSPFLSATKSIPDQDEHSPSPLSPSDIGPSFFLTALTDRLNLPFSLEGLDLSASPRSTSPPGSTSLRENELDSDSPILQPCAIPGDSSEGNEASKSIPATPEDGIPTESSVIIADKNQDSPVDSSTSRTQTKTESIHNSRISVPYIKRFSMIESAGVVKGILPHLKKKKPSILGQSNSLRRKSRRIAPQLLHIDTNVTRKSLLQQQSVPVESISSDESIVSCNHNSSEESVNCEVASTTPTSASEHALYKPENTPASNKVRDKPDASRVPGHGSKQDLNVSLESTEVDADADQSTKPKEASSTKKGIHATKNTKPIPQLANDEHDGGKDSTIQQSSTAVTIPVSENPSRGPNKAKEIEKPTWNETRSVIYQGFALQIINSNAVKNRYLLLMNDLLVVAKPVSREASHNYTLNSRFMVKHIIDLSNISFSASREKERQGRKAIEDGKAPSSSRNPMGELHPLIASTVRRFNVNPYEGIMYMIDKGALRADPLSISTFLHKTPELSRKQIGKFLGMPSNHTILNSYLDRFKFAGIRIDDALRVFLASFRLPGDGNVIDYLVGAFARRWHRANTQYVKYDVETAIKLAFFMMALNADLHNRKSPTKVKMDLPDFIERFRAMDATSDIAESTLIEIFQSIRQDKLETALDDRDYQALSIETRFPLDCHLVIDGTSTRLTITIPAADRDLRIKPVGDGLVCDTPMLDFTYTNSLTFTVKATSLGRKCMTFIKLGARSRKYSSIPAWTVIVEPPFMQHTFQIGFPGDSSGQSRKKFMFGVESAGERTVWLEKITTTFANTFNHTNSELEMIIRRLKNHLISEDSTHSPILSGHELVQCLQAPITSTTSPELRTSVHMKYPMKMPSKSSTCLRPQPSYPTSNKLRPNPTAAPSSNHSRGRNPPSSTPQVYHKGPHKSQYPATTNPSSGRPNYHVDANTTATTMTAGGAKFRIRAG